MVFDCNFFILKYLHLTIHDTLKPRHCSYVFKNFFNNFGYVKYDEWMFLRKLSHKKITDFLSTLETVLRKCLMKPWDEHWLICNADGDLQA